MQSGEDPLIAAVGDDLDPGVMRKRTPPSKWRGPTKPTWTTSPLIESGGRRVRQALGHTTASTPLPASHARAPQGLLDRALRRHRRPTEL
jgi:hypothetical protein